MAKLTFETYLLHVDVLETVNRTVVDKLISEIVDSLIYQTGPLGNEGPAKVPAAAKRFLARNALARFSRQRSSALACLEAASRRPGMVLISRCSRR